MSRIGVSRKSLGLIGIGTNVGRLREDLDRSLEDRQGDVGVGDLHLPLARVDVAHDQRAVEERLALDHLPGGAVDQLHARIPVGRREALELETDAAVAHHRLSPSSCRWREPLPSSHASHCRSPKGNSTSQKSVSSWSSPLAIGEHHAVVERRLPARARNKRRLPELVPRGLVGGKWLER